MHITLVSVHSWEDSKRSINQSERVLVVTLNSISSDMIW